MHQYYKIADKSFFNLNYSIMKTIYSILAALLMLQFAFAGEITGEVYDLTTNQPMEGVYVELFNSGTMKQALTNKAGVYSFKVPSGTYTVVAHSMGMSDTAKNVKVNGDDVVQIALFLSPRVLTQIPVNGKKGRPDDKLITPLDPMTIGKISQEEYEFAPDKKITAMIDRVPGVYVENDQVFVRGARPESTRVMIDGVMVNGNFDVPQNSIDYMRLYFGGIPAKYGDATGGILVIETKSYDFN